MTKLATLLLTAAAATLGTAAMAEPVGAPAAPAAPAASKYSTTDSTIGDLLDNPATKAVLVTHIPQVVSNEGISQARGMTLKAIQAYAGDLLSDEVLAKIDADLAKVK